MSTVFVGGSSRRHSSYDSLHSNGSPISLDGQAESPLKQPEITTSGTADALGASDVPPLGLPATRKEVLVPGG
ncbi:hypothetical protein G647_04789 [Cladophialophora carrionii CBS 160.54]|uniref:Uncharacterized protein n=1 Tax=Cladophialophora carrionii CBS 160.54 TaxID=1279043 RepID=V9D9M0_9EURO|nr:uncharacterized protein G647_04789 [Cladophialophora carrionii CBS 160.54]ETI22993.1 hypothetical protein G647_04789 [Cladophialophora carrionii CBS 160.54]